MELDREVLRIAKLGSWSDAEAKRVVGAWRRSGESRAAFGRRHGIRVHRLYFWIAKFAERSEGTRRKGIHFHPVEVIPDGAVTSQPIEIRSVRVPRGFGVEELRAVISALDMG
jgi:transposase-like protein